MKLIHAIVRSDDGDNVTEELNARGFSVTKLATTGGFMRKGNTTLLIGTEEDKVEQVIGILKKECGKREQVVFNMPYAHSHGVPVASYSAVPTTVDVGGATIFVIDVEQFVRV